MRRYVSRCFRFLDRDEDGAVDKDLLENPPTRSITLNRRALMVGGSRFHLRTAMLFRPGAVDAAGMNFAVFSYCMGQIIGSRFIAHHITSGRKHFLECVGSSPGSSIQDVMSSS